MININEVSIVCPAPDRATLKGECYAVLGVIAVRPEAVSNSVPAPVSVSRFGACRTPNLGSSELRHYFHVFQRHTNRNDFSDLFGASCQP